MGVRPLVALVFATGCSASGTSLVVELSLRAGDAPPSALAVSVFGDRPLVLGASVASPSLPGRLLVQSLPDVDQTVRVAVVGMSQPRSLAGARVPIAARRQNTFALTLSTATLDSDGDGVPDEIDDCPELADPRQDGSCSGADLAVPDGSVDLSRTPPRGAASPSASTRTGTCTSARTRSPPAGRPDRIRSPLPRIAGSASSG